MQELLGGKFGEMSTFMNYTYQSFNFRNRQGARPFFDLVASIAAEEFGHVELVAATINTMLTGASADDLVAGPAEGAARRGASARTTCSTSSPAARARSCQDSMAKPWNGSYVFSSGDLVEDLTHNFFLETGARNNKLKVYEMVDHPAARALTGYLLVRGGVHQVAYARALENLTGANLMKLFPSPRIPTDKIPESRVHIDRGEHLKLYRFSPDDYRELAAVFNGPHPEKPDQQLVVVDGAPEGVPAHDLPPQPAVFAPDYAPEEIAEIARKLRTAAGLSDEPTGVVASTSANGKRATRNGGSGKAATTAKASRAKGTRKKARA